MQQLDHRIPPERPSEYLYRTATAYLRAGSQANLTAEVEVAARALFGNDPPTRALIQRAATTPATTTCAGWADALASKSVFDADALVVANR